MRKLFFPVLSSVLLSIASAYLGMAVIDIGCGLFDFPNFPFADAAGSILVVFGATIFTLGLTVTTRYWVKHFREKTNEKFKNCGETRPDSR